MKKYLLSALALPLLFACSSEDLTEQEVISNDQFAGIEKVDATFFMDEGITRMASDWDLEEGDTYGFAWLGDGTKINPATDGIAYQNHPLTQTGGIFKPATSIYVGKYYIYRPYDESVVSPEAIHFTSLETQTLKDGMGGQAWRDLAKNAIVIGDKWTDVTTAGANLDDDGVMWNQAGIDKKYKIWAAVFSNQTGLDLTYVKNNVAFDGKAIAGATDIAYTYPAGSTIGAADIYSVTVQLTGAAKSFTYAPIASPNTGDHDGGYWANKSNLTTNVGDYFTWATGTGYDVITLNAPDENGISTDKSTNKGWFWFNSLPVTNGDAASTTNVQTVLETSYGTVTVTKTLAECAYAYEAPSAGADEEWIKLAAADDASKTPKEWNPASHNTFVNQYGNHPGKYALTVDFKDGVMTGMHIKNDTHLQKALKYYIASGKTEDVVLNLDEDANGEFKISKISIALIQTIKAAGHSVTVQACGTHGTPKIIVTQDGQDAIGLADKKEVPALNNVFATTTDIYLSSACEWTWAGGVDGETALAIDANVSSITNEGALTVNATNVETSPSVTIENASGATMNVTQVTTVKNHLRNLGTLNVGSESNTSAELRAYGKVIANQATALDAYGTINNYGVVGVTAGTSGVFRNFGLINMMNNDAITLLTANESGTNPFGSAFSVSPSNKMGTVVLPEGNPYALVSVSNGAETGFIKYNWTGDTYTHDAGNVKYNTIVVSNDIEFTGDAATEIQYIEFNGTRTKVVNPAASSKLTNLKGIIVDNEAHNASIIIEKTNQINCLVGAYLGTGATVYKGGAFTKAGAAFVAADAEAANNYFGAWSLDQIVEY